jgi:hypothetical protein
MHYLYRHIRLDINQPFYIGIGTMTNKKFKTIKSRYSRANSKTQRSKYWNSIIDKTNYEVEILLESDDYEFIKQKEIEFIKLYGRVDNKTGILCNLTDGGDGALGCICSKESSIKKSINSKKSLLGKKGKYHPAAKPIYQYNLEGAFIKKWDSIIDTGFKCLKPKSSSKNGNYFFGRGYLWSHNFNLIIDKYKKFDYVTHKKEIEMFDLNNNKLNTFTSVKEAAIYLNNISAKADISKAANGKRKSAVGYFWKYKN